jgi:glycosyltransferase involved in cell wall biosynthesis
MTSPLITVLTTVYNDAPYIGECIESILAQTYEDFRYLIVDDGSTDGTQEIVRSYQDPRLQLIELPENVGISKAANRGLAEIDTRYVARIDGDDVAMPQRLTKQVAFMEAHPEVGVCGSWARHMGHRTDQKRLPRAEALCKARTAFAPPFVHSSAVFRMDIFRQFQIQYREDMSTMVDYALWWDLLPHTKFANIPEELVYYRLSDTNISLEARPVELERLTQLFTKQWEKLGLSISTEQAHLHAVLAKPKFFTTQDSLTQINHWLKKLKSWNKEAQLFPQREFAKVIAQRWERLFYFTLSKQPQNVFRYWALSRGVKREQLLYLFRYYGKRITS